MKSTDSLKFTLIFVLSFCALFLLPNSVLATEGVAVTGSFATYEYTVVQGETLNSPLINIIFYNDYSKDVVLQLSLDAPDGITIPLDEESIIIEANSHLDIPISIAVDQSVPAGTHEIAINATLINNAADGQISTGTDYILQSKVYVVEQSSQLNATILDIKDNALPSQIYLYKLTDNSKFPAGYSDTGDITSILAPGQYEIAAYYNNYQIASKQVFLESNTSITEYLNAETVFIRDYAITPIYEEEDTDKLKGINTYYILENIYNDLENVRVTLNIYKDDIWLEEMDINSFDILNSSIYENNYKYISDSKFEDGSYKFVLKVYSDQSDSISTLCSQSLPAVMNVYKTRKSFTEIVDIRIILLISLIGLTIGLYLLFRFISKKIDPDPQANDDSPALDTIEPKIITAPDNKQMQDDSNNHLDTEPQDIPSAAGGQCSTCDGKEQMICPECSGKGKIKYGAIEEECMYCSGLGIVLCASCVNRKHLRICPRCNGASFTEKDNEKVECTFCNSLGYVLIHQHAKYIDDKKVKLGAKEKDNNKK